MKLHSNTLTRFDLEAALPSGVQLASCIPGVSRSHARAYEVALRGCAPRHFRRPQTRLWPDDPGEYAATYYDWGRWLADLYELEPSMKVGPYGDRHAFHVMTDGEYMP